ncbi:flavoprotein [Listeria rocourtiae FSL F6-920]|nr:flavoprotein [Listeria rocourtiae FSL F6-920]
MINEYDGFVLVFPQYNWGYPAVLKNVLDFLYDEWRVKSVSIMCYVSYGDFQAAFSRGRKSKTLIYNAKKILKRL